MLKWLTLKNSHNGYCMKENGTSLETVDKYPLYSPLRPCVQTSQQVDVYASDGKEKSWYAMQRSAVKAIEGNNVEFITL